MVPGCVTTALLDKALQQYLNKNVRVLDYTNTLAVPCGDSYNSNLVRSRITYSTGENGKKETKSILVKCCPQAQNNKFEVTNDMKFFDREIQMYTIILPQIEKILGDMGGLSAEYIYVERDPTKLIVMEDLSESGFKMLDRRCGLDLEHCKLVVTKLAQLHAASIVLHKAKPEEFVPFQQALFPGNHAILFWINLGIKEVIKACSKRPNMKKYGKKLELIQEHVGRRCAEAVQPKLDHFNVLNHGDCWTNNMMFRYNTDGTLNDLRFVDYQIGVFSSPAIDLHYFWCTSPNLEVRRHHLDTILDCYYNEFVSVLGKIECTIENIPSKGDFRTDWNSRGYYGLAAAVTVLAVSRSESREDATLEQLLEVGKDYEGTFCHHAYNNSVYWENLEYILPLLDSLGTLDL